MRRTLKVGRASVGIPRTTVPTMKVERDEGEGVEGVVVGEVGVVDPSQEALDDGETS